MFYLTCNVGVVLTLTHGYNAVRGHRTGSNTSGAEEEHKTEDNTHNTETSRIPQTKIKR